ncbi:MAG: hypothetical protein ABSE64_15980 [Vulcanimicrobiaceae bacterium]|jgi:hypothetical protein
MREEDTEYREIYRMPAKEDRSHAEEILASQVIMEEFMSGSVRGKFESYEKKLEDARRAPDASRCALCGTDSHPLQPLGTENSPLVCEDCKFNYCIAFQWVCPPAVMMDRKGDGLLPEDPGLQGGSKCEE